MILEKSRNEKGFIRLNQLTSYDRDFVQVPCKSRFIDGVACDPITFESDDPRLISSAHNGQKLLLDAPPLNGKLTMAQVARQPNFSPIYNNYSDIEHGQINYYINRQLAVPFIPQLFVTSSVINKQVYLDPMDSFKPHYCRLDNSSKKPCDGDSSCLSWIRDSQFHREDLLSKQLFRRNQQNFEVNLQSSIVPW